MKTIHNYIEDKKEQYIKHKKVILILLIILPILLIVSAIWGMTLANNDGVTLRNTVIKASEEGDYKKIQEIFYIENRTLTKEEAKKFMKYHKEYYEPDLQVMATFLNKNKKEQYVDGGLEYVEGVTPNEDNFKPLVRLHRGNKFLGFWQGYRAELLTTNFEEEDNQESIETEPSDTDDNEDVSETPDVDEQRLKGGGAGY